MNGSHRQRGISMVGGLLALISVCFVALLVLRIVPLYIAYFTVQSALDGLKKEPQASQMTVNDIYNTLQKRFDIGYVTVVQAKQVKIRYQGKDRVLSLHYEDRRPLIGNLDVIATFNINVVLSP
jgi:hypothetical protein